MAQAQSARSRSITYSFKKHEKPDSDRQPVTVTEYYMNKKKRRLRGTTTLSITLNKSKPSRLIGNAPTLTSNSIKKTIGSTIQFNLDDARNTEEYLKTDKKNYLLQQLNGSQSGYLSAGSTVHFGKSLRKWLQMRKGSYPCIALHATMPGQQQVPIGDTLSIKLLEVAFFEGPKKNERRMAQETGRANEISSNMIFKYQACGLPSTTDSYQFPYSDTPHPRITLEVNFHDIPLTIKTNDFEKLLKKSHKKAMKFANKGRFQNICNEFNGNEVEINHIRRCLGLSDKSTKTPKKISFLDRGLSAKHHKFFPPRRLQPNNRRGRNNLPSRNI